MFSQTFKKMMLPATIISMLVIANIAQAQTTVCPTWIYCNGKKIKSCVISNPNFVLASNDVNLPITPHSFYPFYSAFGNQLPGALGKCSYIVPNEAFVITFVSNVPMTADNSNPLSKWFPNPGLKAFLCYSPSSPIFCSFKQ